MKKLVLCGLAAFAFTTTAAHAQFFFTIDQQNTTGTTLLIAGGVNTGVGESFTPTLTSLNAATFPVLTQGTSSTMVARLFGGGGFSGTLLGTSQSVVVTSTTSQTFEFDFATPQVLVPGSLYTLQLYQIAGDSFGTLRSTTNSYAGGNLYNLQSNPFTGFDLVFAEGLSGGGECPSRPPGRCSPPARACWAS